MVKKKRKKQKKKKKVAGVGNLTDVKMKRVKGRRRDVKQRAD